MRSDLTPWADRGPLRVMFVITSMPVGGAETLLVNLIRRLDRDHFAPEVCCLKEPGPLGDELAAETPVHARLLAHKFDLGVWGRLTRLLRQRRVDAVVTVGAGDKMFWGRLAAWRVGAPVVLSALHSTGWPDGVGRLNRWLTSLTDGFIGVAQAHGRHLVEREGFPAAKVFVIPNGVDVARFRPSPDTRAEARRALGFASNTPVCGIVAALRPEKNHELFLNVAARVAGALPEARFLIIGDGPRRAPLEETARELGLSERALFLGTRKDIPDLLNALDLFALTSHNEANPVSILEALACGVPVVSSDVGSVAEAVEPGVTGYLAPPGDAEAMAEHWLRVLRDPWRASELGRAGRAKVASEWSLDHMARGYQELIQRIYNAKCGPRAADQVAGAGSPPPRRQTPWA